MLNGEATNTNCIVFGLTRPGLEPTIYHTRGEHANHYATDAVMCVSDCSKNSLSWIACILLTLFNKSCLLFRVILTRIRSPCVIKLSINVRENWRANQEWTIQRNRQHRAHKTQDEDNKNPQETNKSGNTEPTKNSFWLPKKHSPCHPPIQYVPDKITRKQIHNSCVDTPVVLFLCFFTILVIRL